MKINMFSGLRWYHPQALFEKACCFIGIHKTKTVAFDIQKDEIGNIHEMIMIQSCSCKSHGFDIKMKVKTIIPTDMMFDEEGQSFSIH